MSAQEQITLSQFLSQQYLCESLTISEVQTLLEFTEQVTFRRDAIIADVGEVGEALYFVIKGEAAMVYEAGGQTIEIGSATEGELIGEMSFFDREPRSVRLVARSTDTRLLRLTRALYQRLRVEHPFICVNLLEHAIISLDRLFRRLSQDVVTFTRYVSAGKGE